MSGRKELVDESWEIPSESSRRVQKLWIAGKEGECDLNRVGNEESCGDLELQKEQRQGCEQGTRLGLGMSDALLWGCKRKQDSNALMRMFLNQVP